MIRNDNERERELFWNDLKIICFFHFPSSFRISHIRYCDGDDSLLLKSNPKEKIVNNDQRQYGRVKKNEIKEKEH